MGQNGDFIVELNRKRPVCPKDGSQFVPGRGPVCPRDGSYLSRTPSHPECLCLLVFFLPDLGLGVVGGGGVLHTLGGLGDFLLAFWVLLVPLLCLLVPFIFLVLGVVGGGCSYCLEVVFCLARLPSHTKR